MSRKILQSVVYREFRFDSIKECCSYISSLRRPFAIEELVDDCGYVYLGIFTPYRGHSLDPVYERDSVYKHLMQKYICWNSYRQDQFLHCLDCSKFEKCLLVDRSDEDPYVEFCAIFAPIWEVVGDD